ncbi:MAG: hypothetical protein ACPLKX_02470 [Dictyoglomaceae bacterium]
MKRIFLLTFFFLFFSLSTAQDILEVSLVKVIKLGNESLNFFKLLGNILAFSQKDILVLYNIKDDKEICRFRIGSSKVRDSEDIFVTNFQFLDNERIFAVNNEPFLAFCNFSKRSITSFSYDKETTLTVKTQILTEMLEKIEDLIVSPLGNYLVEKIHIYNYLIGGFILLDDWYEYNFLTTSKREKLFTISTKKDYLEFDFSFSNKEQYLFIFNPILRDSKKSYALIIKDPKTGKDLGYFYENERIVGFDLSKNDKYLALSLDRKEETKLIDLNTLKEFATFPYIGNPIFGPSENLLAIEGNSVITVFSLSNNRVLFSIRGSHPVFSWDNKFLAYSLGEHFLAPTKEIVVYSWNREVRKKIFLDNEYFLEKMEFTQDGRYLVILLMGGDGYKILIFQIRGG